MGFEILALLEPWATEGYISELHSEPLEQPCWLIIYDWVLKCGCVRGRAWIATLNDVVSWNVAQPALWNCSSFEQTILFSSFPPQLPTPWHWFSSFSWWHLVFSVVQGMLANLITPHSSILALERFHWWEKNGWWEWMSSNVSTLMKRLSVECSILYQNNKYSGKDYSFYYYKISLLKTKMDLFSEQNVFS